MDIVVIIKWKKHSWYSLAPIAAILDQHNIAYRIIKNNIAKVVHNEIANNKFVVYAESTRTIELPRVIKRTKQLKQFMSNEEGVIVLGGPHISGAPGDIKILNGDIGVIGEAELTLPILIDHLRKNGFDCEALQRCPNLVLKDISGNIKLTRSTPIVDLDKIPSYSDNAIFPLHPPVELMRGCFFRCRFCQVPYLHGNPKYRSIDTIDKIIRHYIDYYKRKNTIDIRFIASNSLGYMEKQRHQPNIKALRSLLKKLRQYPVRIFFGTFPSEIRPEYISEETIEVLKLASNKKISIGLQSGSDRVLKSMNRNHTLEDGLRSVELLSSEGFKPIVDYLLGAPGESEEEQWETLNLAKSLQNVAKARFHYLIPLPGTPWRHLKPAPLGVGIQKEIGQLAQKGVSTGSFQIQYDQDWNSYS